MAREYRKPSGGRLSAEILASWNRNESNDVFELVSKYAPTSVRELTDALIVDLTESWKRGAPRVVADYFKRLPDLASDTDQKLRLVQCDFFLRCEYSSRPDLDSYAMQFPEIQPQLRQRLQDTIGFDYSEAEDGWADGSPVAVRPENRPAAPQDATPKRLGRYTIRGEVGSGQFGKVYRAFDEELRRVVAVKVPRHKHLPPSDIEAFRDEASNLAQLDHPHVVSIYDIGTTENGEDFVVTKFVEGQTLQQALIRRQFAHAETAMLLAMVSDALHAAHSLKIVHRDIKPANILLDAEYRPYVADFGLSVSERQRIPGGGEIVGTPAYMSPEQTRGTKVSLNGRSDIWSIGVVLYEMMCGKRPFRGSVLEVFHGIQESEPEPRLIDVQGIPSQLERICTKCLQKDQDERYADAEELAADLRAFAASADRSHQPHRLIATTMLEAEPFPVFGCTIVNRSDEPLCIISVRVDTLDFCPLRGVAVSRMLTPVTCVDVELRRKPGTDTFPLSSVVLIAPQDAATLAVRCLCPGESGSRQSPADVGGFRFRLSFVTDMHQEITSDEFQIGRLGVPKR